MPETPEQATDNTVVTETETTDERPYSAEACAVAGGPEHHNKEQQRASRDDSNKVVAATQAANRAPETEPDDDRPHAAEAIAVAGTPKNNWFPPLDFWNEKGPHINPVSDTGVQLPTNNTTLEISQPEANADVSSIEGHQPITDMWSDLIECFAQRGMIHESVRNLGEGLTPSELSDKLFQIGITDNPKCGSVHRLIRYICEGSVSALLDLRQHLTTLGTGHTTTEDMFRFASLLRYSDSTGDTIRVSIDYEEFTDMTLQQREDVCRLWKRVSNSVEVTLTVSRVTEAYLRCNHSGDLGVSKPTVSGDTQDPTPRALEQIEPDSTELTVLREIVSEPGRTMSYDQLDAQMVCSRSRLRQCLSQALEPLDLVKTYTRKTDKLVTGLPAATTLISEFESEYGVQSSLSGCVSDPPNNTLQGRETEERDLGEKVSRDDGKTASSAGDTADSTEDGGRPAAEAVAIAGSAETDEPESDSTQEWSQYRTVYMSQSQHTAIMGAGGVDGQLALVDTDIGEEYRKRNLVSVSHTPREVAISVPATTPLSFIMGFSTALASPLVTESALKDSVLDTVIDNTEIDVIRRCRQIGVMRDDESIDAGDIRGALMAWGDRIADMTRQLSHGEYGECDTRKEFVSKMMSDAHGLAGTMVHLLDMCGFDVGRDIRMPTTLSQDRKEALSKCLVHSLMVQSRYDSHTGYRKLIEDREEKRQRALEMEVDADDSAGSVIGGGVIRGKSAQCMESVLQEEIEDIETHEDAPEFTIPIGIQIGLSREDISMMTAQMLSRKQMHATRGAVSVLHSVVSSPVTLTNALSCLEEDGSVGKSNRCVEPREIRFALQQIDSEELLSELPRSAGKILSVLLDQNQRVSGAQVAREAGISTQTVRNHKDALSEAGLISITDDGMRVAIGVESEDEKNREAGMNTPTTSVKSGVSGYPAPQTTAHTSAGEPAESVVDICRCGDAEAWGSVVERLAPSQSDPDEALSSASESAHHTPVTEHDGSISTLDSPHRVVMSVGPTLSQQPITGWGDVIHRSDESATVTQSQSQSRSQCQSHPQQSTPNQEENTSSKRDGKMGFNVDFSGVEIRGAIE